MAGKDKQKIVIDIKAAKKEVESFVEKAKEKIKEIGKAISSAFDISQIKEFGKSAEKIIDGIKSEADDIECEIEIEKEIEIKIDTDDLEEDLKKAKKEIDDFVENAKKKLKSINKSVDKAFDPKDVKKFEKKAIGAIKDVQSKADDITCRIKLDDSDIDDGLEKLAKKAELGALGTGTALDGILDVGKQIMSSTSDMDSAVNGYIAATGASAAETEKYQGVLESIYGNNYGDSFEDIAGSMAYVSQTMGDMDDAALQEMVESAYLLQDTFDMDVSESVNGVKSLMDDFGISSEEAFNLVAQGAQSGLNSNGDLLDQISEYGENFADAGLSAEEMFNAMAEGVDASSVNFEEMDEKALEAMGNIQGGISSTTDAMGAMEEVKYDDIGSMFEGLQRSLELLLIPLGEQLIPLFTQVIEMIMPALEELLPIVTDAFSQLLPPLMEMINAVLPVLIDLFSAILPPLMDLMNAILPILVDLFNTLLPPLIELVQAILPPLIEVFNVLIEPLTDLIDMILPPLVDLFDSLKPLIAALMPIIKTLAEIFSGVLGEAIEAVQPIIEGIMEVLSGIITFITGIFEGDWQKAWDGIVGIFKGIFNLIPSIVEGIINGAIAIINGIIKGINKITSAIGLGEIGLIAKVQLPRFHDGGIVEFKGAYEGPILAKDGEMVLTQGQQKNLFDLVNGSASMNAAAGAGGNYSFNYTFNSPKTLSLREIRQEMTLAEQRQRLVGR